MKLEELKLSIDILLIIECCKENPSDVKIKEYVNKMKNWNDFIYKSGRHGVLPMVYKSLKVIDDLNIPLSTMLELKENNLKISKENMLLTSELIKVTKLLDKEKIQYIAFKGPTLSYMEYGDITLRQYCDLDILVDIKSLEQFSNLLIKNDFYTNEKTIFLRNKFFISTANDFSFFSKTNVHIELHWNLFRQIFSKESKQIDIWNNINKVEINKNNINTMNNELLFVYLSIHGSKHLWERIEWVVDLNKLIINNNLDWKIIESLSKKLNVDTMLNLGLLLVSELFSTELPKNLEKRFKTKDLKLKALVLNMYKTFLFFEEGNIKHMIYKFKTISLMKNTKLDRIKYLFSILFKPTQYDVYFINIPSNISFLYYIIRPYRFLYNKFFNK